MSRLRAFVNEFEAPELFSGMGPTIVVSLACFYDWRMMPKMERLTAAGYDAIYMALPLSYMAMAGAQRFKKTMAALMVVVFALVTANQLQAKVDNWNKNWALDDPQKFLTPLAIAGALAIVGFLVSGATSADWRVGLRDPRRWGPKVALACGILATASLLGVLVVPQPFVTPLGIAGALALLGFFVSGAASDDWGIGLGDWRWWGPKMAIAIAIIVPASFLVVLFVPGLREFYPQDPQGRASFYQLCIGQLLRGACLLGEEFFWHGFALFAISRTHGKRAAVIITSFGYFMLHKGKPEIEMLSSFVGAALLAVACLRCKTFWPAFIGHWPMNFCVEAAAYLYEGPRTDHLHQVHGLGG